MNFREFGRTLGMIAAGLFLGVGALAWLATGSAQAAPEAPEAYAGNEICAECHSDEVEAFEATAHGQRDLSGWRGDIESCESCHGPGADHVDAGGDPDLIANPAGQSAAQVSANCLSCHRGGELGFWAGSHHESNDISCVSCHRLHQPVGIEPALAQRTMTDQCLSCHSEQRKHMLQRSRHPLREGQMSCASCHSPHGSANESAMRQATVNDTCTSCHAELRGPFLWEHQPVRESCLTCHDSHGSNQENLLKVAAPRLCQSCHLFGHHQTVPGQPTQVWNLNNSCVNCHHNIHGSNHPSGVIFMQ